MGVTQYIGSRYVPVFADPAEWNNTRTYEPLTIVLHEGNSYTSKQYVPKGVDITNGDYWAETGNYNSQVEQYRKEVLAFDGRITANSNAISSETTRAKNAENTNADAISELESASKNIGYLDRHVVILGDSWSDTSRLGYEWPSVIGNADGYKYHNYAILSASFTKIEGRPYILDQVTTAASDSSFDNNNVSNVIIMGGLNDYRDSVSSANVLTAIQSLESKLKTNFPNARMNMLLNFQYPVGEHQMLWMCQVINRVNGNTKISCDSLINTLYGGTVHWNSDGYHPNKLGQQVLANVVRNVLFGGGIPRLSFSLTSGEKIGGDTIWLSSVTCGYNGGEQPMTLFAVNTSQEISAATQTTFVIPPSNSRYTMGCITDVKQVCTTFSHGYAGSVSISTVLGEKNMVTGIKLEFHFLDTSTKINADDTFVIYNFNGVI